ncbi:hypothetical protein GQ53DRAFT_752983 [Thozetella sp. PMI_491]|nr:hypothetical protein GQ53DRAFT_752983 [Thozetella sp. PMI_491]
MTSLAHKIDPDGDVILILQNPDAPFAVWDGMEGPGPAAVPSPFETPFLAKIIRRKLRGKKARKQANAITPSFWSLDPGKDPQPLLVDEFPTDDELSSVDILEPPEEPLQAEEAVPEEEAAPDLPPEAWPAPEDINAPVAGDQIPAALDEQLGSKTAGSVAPCEDSEVEIRMLLSSKHLILASSYFRSILKGSWKETAISAGEYIEITAAEWDTEALLIVMNIIHGHVRRVPRSISLEMLAKIAVLVDYYKCYEVVELFSDCWIESLVKQQLLPQEHDRDLVLWLTVAWVFSQDTLFTNVSKLAMETSRGPIETLGLPIPQQIIKAIDQRRQDVVARIINELHNLLLYLYYRTECSFECNSTLTGALTKQMYVKGLLNPKPERPLLGYSVAEITRTVREFKSPSWERNAYSRHQCTLNAFLDSTVCSFMDAMDGLNQGYFP